MINDNDLMKIITDIRNHFMGNLNNKYMRNIIPCLDLPQTLRIEMNLILTLNIIYFDSRGAIADIYNSIKAISVLIKIIKTKVLPNLDSYSGNANISHFGEKQVNSNERIIAQMAFKNYPMNITILSDLVYKLFTMMIENDKSKFPDDPAIKRIKDVEEIGKNLIEGNKE